MELAAEAKEHVRRLSVIVLSLTILLVLVYQPKHRRLQRWRIFAALFLFLHPLKEL